MTKRLATMLLVTMLLTGVGSQPVRAQNADIATLKGLDVVGKVEVAPLSDTAKKLGLTEQTIQTDVELKLRLAGIRILTAEEAAKLPGNHYLWVQVNVTDPAVAASIVVAVVQSAWLQRNDQFAPIVITWLRDGVMDNPTTQFIRDRVKDHVDQFLNDWLSVNQKATPSLQPLRPAVPPRP